MGVGSQRLEDILNALDLAGGRIDIAPWLSVTTAHRRHY